MVRFIAMLLAASGLAAAAIPGPGTYTISQEDRSLALKQSKGIAIASQSNATESAQQWVLESTQGSKCGTFKVKNVKFGTYLGYPPRNVRDLAGSPIVGVEGPVQFTLFPGNKPDEFYLMSKERMGINYEPFGPLPANADEFPKVFLRQQYGYELPWVFKKAPAPAPAPAYAGGDKSQESCSPN
ncbi:hypothetical protein FRC12_019748 [Ceratobasidium sp. 428]|nr:hypothetical protein FRC09_010476 [Ceratobasidium sp. 395]KAG8783416.1 hypothetical protein FRC12_019748 [Ceratobasidium sp. 428]